MVQIKKQTISNTFGKHSMSYDRHSALQKKVADHLIMSCPDSDDVARILEIGCGTGHFTRNLQKKYPHAELVVTDISADMLAACKAKSKRTNAIAYHVMDGENINATMGHFDLIASSMTVQWFRDPKNSIEAWADRLTADGYIALSTLGENYFPEWRFSTQKAGVRSQLIPAPALPQPMNVRQTSMSENYGNAKGFLEHLINTGASTSIQNGKSMSVGDLKSVMRAYDENYRGEITWNLAIAKWQP